MTMKRIPESLELMSGLEQAQAYALADLSGLNNAIINAFQQHFPDFTEGVVVDLGCGAADVAVRFARAYPAVSVVGVEGATYMIEMGRRRVQEAGLTGRIEIRSGHLPNANLGTPRFDAVIANSLLHHLHDPAGFWNLVRDCAKPGAAALVVDLIRPQDPDRARAFVKKYAERAHPLVQADFFDSLCAAYTVDEVREQLDKAGLKEMQAEVLNELQLKVWGRPHKLTASTATEAN